MYYAFFRKGTGKILTVLLVIFQELESHEALLIISGSLSPIDRLSFSPRYGLAADDCLFVLSSTG